MVKSVLVLMLLAGAAGAAVLPDAPANHAITREDAGWIVAGFGSASFDAITTQRNLARGCVEANPIVGAHPNAGALWGFVIGMTAAQEFAAWEFRRHGHQQIARVVAGAVVAGHAAAGGHNLTVLCN